MTQQIINVGEVANDGTGESLRTAFEAVNNNFSQIWASGPVNTNVVIANNVISTVPVNTPLVLAPGGIGNVQSNAHIVPGVTGVYDLGAPSKRWDSVFADYYYGNGFFLTGISAANASSLVSGNSSILINGDGTISVNINNVPDVVVFSPTGVDVAGGINATGEISSAGNVTGNYFIGDGSQLTGIVASSGAFISNGNSNVTIGQAASNVTVAVSGVGNVAVFTPTGLTVSNNITVNSLTATSISGNGAAISRITGANVVGNVGNAVYAYTAGTAGIASLANTVTNPVQSNITSVGVLTALSVAGSIRGNYIYGNGRYLTGIQGGNASGTTVTFANIAPAQPNVGDVWIQANTGTQFLWFNDDTSNQWAEMEAYQSYGTTLNQGSGGYLTVYTRTGTMLEQLIAGMINVVGRTANVLVPVTA